MIKHLFAALLCLLPALGFAQEKSRAILVLDASGSMWGQIDGKAKITIAQEVIGDLLQSLPAEQELGLTVYGHRRKGDCSDIETMILPGGDTRNAIMMAVSAITPKGKTPLSAAVIQAAEALKYTEERATVILVSDGRETCDLDPCAVGRSLEKAGIDFTAHVIGFDIADAKDRAELQCLAEETGGTFRTASNADELGEALKVIAEPDPVKVTFRAVEGQNGPVIETQLVWWLGHDDKIIIDNTPHDNNFSMDMLAGSGRVEVLRPDDEAVAEAEFMVSEHNMTVTLVLPKLLPNATIDAPDETPAGSEITVNWTGPNKASDVITLASPDQEAAAHLSYFYVDQNANNTATMRVPTSPGIYELRYQNGVGQNDILARKTIKVTEFQFDITAPDQMAVGTVFDLEWKSPSNKGYIISLANPGDSSSDHIAYLYADQFPGTTATMSAPTKPGTYDVRLQDAIAGANILARHRITVTEVEASLTTKDQVEVGETFKVVWDGPNKQINGGGDYIAISMIGSKADNEISYAYTKGSENSAVEMIAPVHPGTYEVRYVLNGDGNRVLASHNLVVVPVTASVDFTNPAEAGGRLAVTWQGPARKISGGGDYIALSKPGSKGDNEITYAYVEDSENNIADLEVPTTPGTYEVRYILNGSDNIILASKDLQVEPVRATLEFASPAPAGGRLTVTWDGPGGDDYIAIAQTNMKVDDEITYTYVNNGDANTLEIDIPTTPGTYEVRYIQKGNVKKMLAAMELVVEPVKATLEFASPAPAGGELAVTWTGPGGADYIAIAQTGMRVNDEVTYSYLTNGDGNTVEIIIPTTPGTYELRYIQKGNERKILAVEELVVDPVTATLKFNAPAPAGGKLTVTWTGPGGADYIAIAQAGMRVNDEVTYAYLNNGEGNTVEIDIPTAPGIYEMRYIQKGNERKILTVEQLDVVPMKASLQASETTPAGDKMEVIWTGPAHRRDTIIIAKPGSDSAEAFASTAAGSPAALYAPMVKGDYEIRYIYGALNKVLATIPLKVE